MRDTISRQGAIDELVRWDKISDYNDGERNMIACCIAMLSALPSAQPDVPDTYVGDMISRQAAIDVADAVWSVTGDKNVAKVWDQIKDLQSVQPVVISKSENTTECEDAVSREAVLDEIHRYMEERDYTIGLLDDNVCGLPPVTPKQPGWIPWDSGKFPEKSGTYTVTAYDGATKRVTYAKYQKRLKRWELTGARAYWRVLAWMPHIEPWEGDANG